MLRQWLRPWLKRSTTHHTTLESLGAPVELRTDQRGVCHILAKNEEDLFRAQGYITARDRLFQMDMLRRTAGGRLAEFYGDVPGVGLDNSIDVRGRGLASIDYLMRVFGLQQAAQAQTKASGEPSKPLANPLNSPSLRRGSLAKTYKHLEDEADLLDLVDYQNFRKDVKKVSELAGRYGAKALAQSDTGGPRRIWKKR